MTRVVTVCLGAMLVVFDIALLLGGWMGMAGYEASGWGVLVGVALTLTPEAMGKALLGYVGMVGLLFGGAIGGGMLANDLFGDDAVLLVALGAIGGGIVGFQLSMAWFGWLAGDGPKARSAAVDDETARGPAKAVGAEAPDGRSAAHDQPLGMDFDGEWMWRITKAAGVFGTPCGLAWFSYEMLQGAPWRGALMMALLLALCVGALMSALAAWTRR